MKKMLSLLAFVALSLTTWAQVQKHDFKEGQFCYPDFVTQKTSIL